jgi:hypothetical protein
MARPVGNRVRGDAAGLPQWIRPQLAELVDAAPDGPEWLHEIKYDGFRMHARLDRGEVRLLTRNGLDWTHKYPQIAAAAASLRARQAYLDGELCGLRPDGITSFSMIQMASDAGNAAGLEPFRARSLGTALSARQNYHRSVSRPADGTCAARMPRHPLFGQRFDLSPSCEPRPGWVSVLLADGRRRWLPRTATDLDLACETMPNHALPRVSVRPLLPLARYVEALLCNSSKTADGAPPSDDRADIGSGSCAPAAGAGAEAVAEDDGGATTRSGTADHPLAAIEVGERATAKPGGSC